jgi:hypothetical protein
VNQLRENVGGSICDNLEPASIQIDLLPLTNSAIARSAVLIVIKRNG